MSDQPYFITSSQYRFAWGDLEQIENIWRDRNNTYKDTYKYLPQLENSPRSIMINDSFLVIKHNKSTQRGLPPARS